MSRRAERHVRTLAVALLFSLLSVKTAAAQAPTDLFLAAEADLDAMRLEQACAAFVKMLSGGPAAAAVGLTRLAAWYDGCDLSGALDAVARGAATAGSPRFRWNAARMARQMLRKYRADDRADAFKAVSLPVLGRSYTPADAPVFAMLHGRPGPPHEGTLASVGVGGVAVSTACFESAAGGELLVRFRLPSPATIALDGKELVTVEPDRAELLDARRMLAVMVGPGCHCFEITEAVDAPTRTPTVHLRGPAAGAGVEGCGPGAGADWTAVAYDHACTLGDEAACAWYEFAQEGRLTLPAAEVAARAASSPAWLQLLLAWIRQDEGVSERQAGLALGALSAYRDASHSCLSGLDLAGLHLSQGQDRDAQVVLDSLDDACLKSAAGRRRMIQLARARDWEAAATTWLADAVRAHPTHCGLASRWAAHLETQGLRLPPEGPVRCAGVELLRREQQARAGERVAAPRSASACLRRGNSLERLGCLKPMAERLEQGRSTREDRHLMARDAQVEWMLADQYLAGGHEELAQQQATRAARHAGAWGMLRSQAGRAFFWQDLLPHVEDIEAMIGAYQSSGFAADMPRVVVLDEGVLVARETGTAALLTTIVVHVVSASAAESVVEIGLDPGEEIMELAVRKADGTWTAPAEQTAGEVKDTLSLPGLAPGDFVVRRSVRELSLAAGPCYVLPPFYFGDRENAVFLTRFVLLEPEALDVRVQVDGELARSEELPAVPMRGVAGPVRVRVFEKRHVLPVPAEPSCPDREAGLTRLHAATACAAWPAVRDRMADALTGYCNAGLPDEMKRAAATPADLFRYLVEHLRGDGRGLLSSPFSEVLESGTGSLPLALWCALTAAGFDASIVLVSSKAAPPLDLALPDTESFDAVVVRVLWQGQELWLDPFDEMASPGYLRPLLRGQVGMMLRPLDGRLFILTPRDAGRDSWRLDLDLAAAADGSLRGTITLAAEGLPAADLAARFRDAPEERRQQVAQAFAAQFVPGVEVTSFAWDGTYPEAGLSLLVVMPAEPGRARRQVALQLPAAVSAGLIELAARRTPLFFGGFYPFAAAARIEGTDGVRVIPLTSGVEAASRFGTVRLRVEEDGDAVEVHKELEVGPQYVGPQDYPEFVGFASLLRKHATVVVEVSRGEDR